MACSAVLAQGTEDVVERRAQRAQSTEQRAEQRAGHGTPSLTDLPKGYLVDAPPPIKAVP